MTVLFVVIVVVVVALIFDFTNGFHDSANAMAGPVATGALKPRTAVVLAAVLNVVGACLSTEVAKTISGGFFDDALISAPIVLAGLVGAIVWNLLTWLLGLPSSSSHALFGGLIGAVMVGAGLASVNYSVIVSKVLLPAIVATAGGRAGGGGWRPGWPTGSPARLPSTHSETGFKYGQAFTASLVALAHGTSDGQKTMGVITLVLIAANLQPAGTGPHWWVVLAAGLAIGLGTYSGGWRIMRTMGKGIVEIETPQGAASGAAATATILASSHLGFGLSTTHVCTGSDPRLRASAARGAEVRWSVARRMLVRLAADPPGRRHRRRPGGAALAARRRRGGRRCSCCCAPPAPSSGGLPQARGRPTNVTDSREVMVLAAAAPSTFEHDATVAARHDSDHPNGHQNGKLNGHQNGHAAGPTPAERHGSATPRDRVEHRSGPVKIDWTALGVVAVVSIVATICSWRSWPAESGWWRPARRPRVPPRRLPPARVPASDPPAPPDSSCWAWPGSLVLFGIYLSCPSVAERPRREKRQYGGRHPPPDRAVGAWHGGGGGI